MGSRIVEAIRRALAGGQRWLGSEGADARAYLRAHVRGSIAVAAIVLVVAATAVLFPATSAGGASGLALVAGLGAGAIWMRHRWSAPLPRWAGRALALLLLAWAAYRLFDHQLGERWLPRDWGTHHAIVAHLTDALADGRLPNWAHALSSGESPYELYPAPTYVLAAGATLLLGMEHDIPYLLASLAVLIHLLIAIGVTRLAARIAPWPLAALAGLLMLFDLGTGASGGADAVLHLGLLHNALATGLMLIALVAVVDSLERSRVRTAVVIWLAAAAGTAAHPTALALALACLPALIATGLLASNVRPRQALIAAINLGIGAGLGALVWLPFTHRLLVYGVHYGSAPDAPDDLVGWVLANSMPRATFAALIAVGWVGMAAGLYSRRAGPTFIGALAITLVVFTSELPYTILELGPSPELARFSAPRLMSLAKPLLYVCAAYTGALICRQLAVHWAGARLRARMAAGAIGAVVLLLLLRGLVPFLDAHAEAIRSEAQDDDKVDEAGLEALIGWARAQASAMPPDRYARLLYDGNRNLLYHVYAESGLPTLSYGATSNLMLRDRMVQRTPEALRRFDVRWVVKQNGSPALGDPASEQQFGSYRVREIPGWDGQFARIERGGGQVRLLHLDDERVEVELSGTSEPALVALGTGYYGRWRARAGDVELPVYALTSAPGSAMRVVAAWVPPGRTTFRPDGELSSDGDGIPIALLALLLALTAVILPRLPRLHRRVLRAIARGRRRLHRRARVVVLAGAGLAAAALLAGALVGALRRAPALRVGAGIAGDAEVRARPGGDGPWRDCPYSAVRGSYRCADLVHVEDGVEALFSGESPSWPLVAPVVRMSPELTYPVEVRVTIRSRMHGTYDTLTQGGKVLFEHGSQRVSLADRRGLDIADTGEPIVLTAKLGAKPLLLGMVRSRDIDPERSYPAAPQQAPACVRGRLPEAPCGN